MNQKSVFAFPVTGKFQRNNFVVIRYEVQTDTSAPQKTIG